MKAISLFVGLCVTVFCFSGNAAQKDTNKELREWPGVAARYKVDTTSAPTLTNITPTLIPFDTQTFDTNSAVTTGASWKFVAPVEGIYRVSSHICLFDTTNFNGSEYIDLKLYKNGSSVSYLASRRPYSGEDYPCIGGNTTIELDKDDDIQIYGVQTSGVNITLSTTDDINHVSVELVN